MKSYLLAVLLSASILAIPAQADARVARCDTCRTDIDFRNRAQVLGPGQHLVYNLSANILQQWYVPWGTPPTDPKFHRQAQAFSGRITKQIPNPAAVEELDRAHEVYVEGGGSLRPIINVPISILDLPFGQNKTAYDVVRDFNLRSMIESAAADYEVLSTVTGDSLMTAIADLKSIATSYLGLRDQVALLFRIVMTDGSYFFVLINLDQPNGEYVEDSARTANGQAIPEEIEDVNGEWNGSVGDDLGPMANHMRILGATLNFVGSSGGTIKSIVCSGTGSAKVCVVRTVIL